MPPAAGRYILGISRFRLLRVADQRGGCRAAWQFRDGRGNVPRVASYNIPMSGQTILAIIALALPAALLVLVIALGHRGRYRFSLQTSLLLIVPLAAVIAWVASSEGPWVSLRRVATFKTSMVSVLLNVACVVAMWRSGWLPRRVVIIFVALFALLFGWLAWKRHAEPDPDAAGAINRSAGYDTTGRLHGERTESIPPESSAGFSQPAE